ncbi:hypothetical protein BJ508DRAFT_336879 [Ascobolus immersus RN42]|uniref:Uncharacterized protein n=1 Tax=Ascobolus immersus RN42 TaxID=1160509 RepID=A0A3N4HC09_ASCIM|nr:hypothetical protein BJ508DRAFT_336879 [Ascobolus immersus RN42]
MRRNADRQPFSTTPATPLNPYRRERLDSSAWESPRTSGITRGTPGERNVILADAGLSEEEHYALQELLEDYKDRFSATAIGQVNDYMAYIPTGDHPLPTPQPLRPANPEKRRIIEDAIKQYLDMDLIEPCKSEWQTSVLYRLQGFE